MGWTAQGLGVHHRKNLIFDMATLKELVQKHHVDSVVVGLPRNMDGSDSLQTKKVREFIDILKKEFTIPIVEWDERLTTKAAEAVLIEADVSRSKRKKVQDKLAAVLILQGYLDSLR